MGLQKDALKEKIMELREQTGVGMLDCKKALEEADGDMDKAKFIVLQRWEITKLTALISYRRD